MDGFTAKGKGNIGQGERGQGERKQGNKGGIHQEHSKEERGDGVNGQISDEERGEQLSRNADAEGKECGEKDKQYKLVEQSRTKLRGGHIVKQLLGHQLRYPRKDEPQGKNGEDHCTQGSKDRGEKDGSS